jgi:prevent-host-death family protein
MRLSKRVKPIGYLKAHADQIVRELAEGADPLVITEGGEAKAILQSLVDYEKTQETLAMLQIVVLGHEDIAAGRVSPAADAFARIRKNTNL